MPILLEPPMMKTNRLSKNLFLQSAAAVAVKTDQKKSSYTPFSWESADPEEYCLEEPPAWHEAVLEERIKNWEEGKIESQSLDEAIRELRAELGIRE